MAVRRRRSTALGDLLLVRVATATNALGANRGAIEAGGTPIIEGFGGVLAGIVCAHDGKRSVAAVTTSDAC